MAAEPASSTHATDAQAKAKAYKKLFKKAGIKSKNIKAM